MARRDFIAQKKTPSNLKMIVQILLLTLLSPNSLCVLRDDDFVFRFIFQSFSVFQHLKFCELLPIEAIAENDLKKIATVSELLSKFYPISLLLLSLFAAFT